MPFENEDKVPFKDLPVCDQLEVIDTLAGKYDDREVFVNISGSWISKSKYRDTGLYLYYAYKVLKKDTTLHINNCTQHYNNEWSVGGKIDGPFDPCKTYKLIPIED